MKKLAIKVDIDTLRGYREGVPQMLDLFKRHEIMASIFFSFGPDNSGKAIRRIFRKGFISKMMRTKAPSTYGIKTLMYGTLIPAPIIVPTDPGIFVRAVDEGHDCGVHAWDHVYVQDKLAGISKEEFRSFFEKSANMFEKLSGRKPLSCAAPGWQISSVSLEVQEEAGLEYCSDTRGRSPFLPVFEGRSYTPVQIPTTLPTMDEILGLPGIDDDSIGDVWLNGMNNEWNVLTVHAEMEGLSKIGVFEKFIIKAKENGTVFYTLADYARDSAPGECNIEIGTITGRAGTLASQEDE
ncbi:MAG TPA: 4-deoxy-4-formamido-L-arabinose-phosphoundecaprenol deformylase [Synergistaceae bacterium]|nr:4-deoxy-4-formamido-L-arabinose-phosphoundecaprenol deformylase [Synergistaceae bacterium]